MFKYIHIYSFKCKYMQLNVLECWCTKWEHLVHQLLKTFKSIRAFEESSRTSRKRSFQSQHQIKIRAIKPFKIVNWFYLSLADDLRLALLKWLPPDIGVGLLLVYNKFNRSGKRCQRRNLIVLWKLLF